MIVCHCMSITDHDIRAAVDWMRKSDSHALITPGKIYHALGKKADCGGCLPLFLDTMQSCDSLEVPILSRGAPARRAANTGDAHERRQDSHRLPESGAAQ